MQNLNPINNLQVMQAHIEMLKTVTSKSMFDDAITILKQSSNGILIGFIGCYAQSVKSVQWQTIGFKHTLLLDHLEQDDIWDLCKGEQSITPLSLLAPNSLQNHYLVPVKFSSSCFGAFLLYVSSDQDVERVAWHWSLLSRYTLNAFLAHIISKPRLTITPREKDCLLWASEGKTSWEIAQILGLSERTVNFHLTNCIEKTESSNRLQAITKFLYNQVI